MENGQKQSAVLSAPGTLLPLAIIDKCIGFRIQIILWERKEIFGILRGFDDFLNMVIEDVSEYTWDEQGNLNVEHSQGILLSGTHVAMLVPCGDPPPADLYKFPSSTASEEPMLPPGLTLTR